MSPKRNAFADLSEQMSTEGPVPPILFLVFNRPEITKRSFEAIAKARPTRLIVVADGPRDGIPGDGPLCEEVRDITSRIDWDCESELIYRSENLGCGEGIVHAIDTFFERFENGIILEDDCVPGRDFFPFCRQMLERHADDETIMSVSGMNLAGRWKEKNRGYHFSRVYHTLGWATWRRAWNRFEPEMKDWRFDACRDAIRKTLGDDRRFAMCSERFELAGKGIITCWDYQWFYTMLLHSGLTIVPCVNLVSNIGFGPGATNTIQRRHPLADLPVYDYPFPVVDPLSIEVDRDYEREAFRVRFGSYSSWWYKSKIKSILRMLGNKHYENARRLFHRYCNDAKPRTPAQRGRDE